MTAALNRYRVMSYVVGVGLILLVFVAMPLKYFGDNDSPMAIIGPAHGFLYVVYLVTVLDLAWKRRWAMVRSVLVMLAGVVPLMSFITERRVVRHVRSGEAGW